MHVHVSAIEFLTVGSYVVIFGFFWRVISAKLSDTKVGQAMAFLY